MGWVRRSLSNSWIKFGLPFFTFFRPDFFSSFLLTENLNFANVSNFGQFWSVFDRFGAILATGWVRRKKNLIFWNFANVSNFGQFWLDFWRMFRILCFWDFFGDDCFEFLARRMRFWANVSNICSRSDRRLARNARRKPESTNVSKFCIKSWTSLPHVEQRTTNLTNVSNFLPI